MPVKSYKPTTPSRRHFKTIDSSSLTKKKPEKNLTIQIKKRSGRSQSDGRITVRHRGGGHKKKYRIIDFKRDKFDQKGKILSLEYDPYRSAFIALIQYPDGEKRYIIASDKMQIGDEVISSRNKIEPKVGNRMPLKYIPLGTFVYNLELFPNQGGRIIRSAGSYGQVMAKEGKYVQIKLPSGEIRNILGECQATVGQVSNLEHESVTIGKAGRKRWQGIRPSVRGKAMNPKDHPHGGGEGRSPIGLIHPKTPWGRPALGVKTRKKKMSDKLIIKRRK